MTATIQDLPSLAEMHERMAVKFAESAERWRVIAREALVMGDLATAIYAGNNVQERLDWVEQERSAAQHAKEAGL